MLNLIYGGDANAVFTQFGKFKLADRASFRVLDDGGFADAREMFWLKGYAADKNAVYFHEATYKPRAVRKADPASFLALGSTYATDNQGAFFEGYRLPGADPATFEVLDSYFARDRSRVYTHRAPILNTDYATWEVVDPTENLSRDRYGYFVGVLRVPNRPEKFWGVL